MTRARHTSRHAADEPPSDEEASRGVRRRMQVGFGRLAAAASGAAGKPATFGVALVALLAWGLLGPAMQYSDTWQLAVNTGTTIITFLMVFLIQNTQNRDTAAIQIKLDELIRATRGARNAIMALEELDDEDVARLRVELIALAHRSSLGSSVSSGTTPSDSSD